MGYGGEVARIAELFAAKDLSGAVAAVPDELVAETAIVGPARAVPGELRRWEAAGVEMLLVGCRSVAELEQIADAALVAK
jgi:hypothetical protein